MKYPEHEKMQEVKNESQAIGEFLEWMMGEKGYTICEVVDRVDGPYMPISLNIEKILAEFFEIDWNKIQDEKDHMLAEIRKDLDQDY